MAVDPWRAETREGFARGVLALLSARSEAEVAMTVPL